MSLSTASLVDATAKDKSFSSLQELTCFSSYDKYTRTGQMEDSLVVAEVFQKYLLRNNEPFLFYCRVPPYAR